MSLLFFAPDIRPPSVLWMRRMLAGLQSDVGRLITEKPAESSVSSAISRGVIPGGVTSIAWRGLRRTGLVGQVPATMRARHWLAAEVASPRITRVLVHYATLAVKYAAVWRKIDKPVFVYCHGYDVTWNLRNPAGRLVHRADYRRSVAELPANVQFIANSRATQQRLLEIGIDLQRTHVHYQGVPVPAAPPSRAASEEITVLYLGRLVDFKGPQLTLMAFDSAVEQGLRGKLIVAGDGPERQKCEEILQHAFAPERIELLGAVDEATGARLRSEADLFTAHNCKGIPSGQEEAYGVSIVEAMADALPVVTGRNGSLPELIDDGVQGLLFQPGDVEAHAAALLRLARDPALRLEMGRHGWERARERFTSEQATESLRSILGFPARDAATNP